MTLSFSTQWPKQTGKLAGQPNYFIEKIWSGFIKSDQNEEHYQNYLLSYKNQFSQSSWHGSHSRNEVPKIHTIRAGNRWRAGMKIHPVINNRTKNRFQFAPTMVCTSVQEIEFKVFEPHTDKPFVYIDGSLIRDENIIKHLALSDGFETVEDFFAYFNADFKGQLIHWTAIEY